MANRVRYPRQNRYPLYCLQKLKIEKAYPCFSCKVYADRLECVGSINPDPDDEEGTSYRIQMVYGRAPEVRVIKPHIEYNKDIHMFSDGSLCLYYPKDLKGSKWSDKLNLHETIFPWTAEWLLYYERYLRSGKWEGPEAPHAVPT